MSVQLLDKTRKINKLLHNNNSSKVVFNDICEVLTGILDSNILVISKKGKVLGSSVCKGVEELQELIRMTLEEASEKEYLPLNEKIELSRELFHAFRKLDILQELLEDPKITEIMVNGTDHIFYEKGGRLFRSERKFMSEERLVDVIQQIVGEANRYVSEASPIVDARLKDGSRVNVVMKPVAVNGPILTIRTFPEEPLTMKNDRRSGTVHQKIGYCKI